MTLVGVTSSAGTAAIHSMSMDGGIMRMRKLDSLPVPAGSTVKLERRRHPCHADGAE